MNNQEELWRKKNPLAEFDFITEPKEEWAKQIIYNHVPFANEIRCGSTCLEPNVYFSLYTPNEKDLHQMLNNITLEKDALNISNSEAHTQVKSSRKPSEPFSKPAVTNNEKDKAIQLIQLYGIQPVQQEKGISPVSSKKEESLPTINPDANQTVLPEVKVPLAIQPTVENISVIDLENLSANIPSLRKQIPNPIPPVVTEINPADSSFTLNDPLLDPPHLPSIPMPISPVSSKHESPSASPFPVKVAIATHAEPPKRLSTEPILNRSVETTRLSSPSLPPATQQQQPVQPVPLFSGSNSELMGTILFGSKEAGKEFLETPIPKSDPLLFHSPAEGMESSTVPQMPASEAQQTSPYASLSSSFNKSSSMSMNVVYLIDIVLFIGFY